MGLFDDILDFGGNAFDSLTGQINTPTPNILDPNALLSQSYGALNAQLPALNAYNQNLALGNAQAQLGYESAINPYANQVRSKTYSSILDNLNAGGSFSPEVERDVSRRLAERFGSFLPTEAGGAGFNYQTGLEQENLRNQRIAQGMGASNALALTGAQYNPIQGFGADAMASMIQQENTAKNIVANQKEFERQENFTALLNTGTKILGGIAGGFIGSAMGNPVGGALGGAAAGSTVFGRAQGNQGQSAGILAGLFGGGNRIGGPQYGIGGGQWYGGDNNMAMQSIRAQPVTLGS